MTWNPCLEPTCPTAGQVDQVEILIVPRARDLGGFEVRRVLPASKRQMVGPFIFFDQMGPAEFPAGEGLDVLPHPHVGLATVTYLFDGEILHRDSLGTRQAIRPGEVNWMVAGRGITHSERTSAEVRAAPSSTLFGIQTWVALPKDDEDAEPGFQHLGRDELPAVDERDLTVRLILGTLYGLRNPVQTFSDMFYADARLDAGARLPLDPEHEDRGLYVVRGEIEVAGRPFGPGQMIVFRPGDSVQITATEPAQLILLGGDTLDGPRHIWWNFVASSRERLEAAKEAWREGDWQHGRFRLPPDDDAEYTPLPG